ncbi:MAG: FtsQ-type POTRA domain-containing protein [Clostridiaceae bacterium]|nr:FtsQ-type POTRA domain-containing protein [Clostridiaceae bacterium]
MTQTVNEYIKKAKRRKKIKKMFFLFTLILICAGIIIIYTDLFKIKYISVTGDNLVTKDYITEQTKSLKGENILFISNSKLMNKLKDDPYVKNVEIKRKYPNSIEIKVTEKKGLFYVQEGEKYKIISCDMDYVEETDSIEDRNLIQLKGLDLSNKKLGDKLEENPRIETLLNNIYVIDQLIADKSINAQLNSFDITDLSKIRGYIGEIEVYVGSDENFKNKMVTALGIYEKNIAKKYINVSFDGSPDIE